jgi:apolipoprotein N-acyltransferase
MRRVAPLLAAIGSGAAMALALPLVVPWISLRELDPAGWAGLLAWVALVPLVAALERAGSVRAAAGLGFAAGLACFYVAIHWVSHAMTAFGGLPGWVAFVGLSALVAFMAAHWALAAAAAFVVRRALGWPYWVHLPFIWTATELLRNYLFTGYPWANLGYTQVRFLPVAQLAALGGVYAIAFLVVLVNGALAEALHARRTGHPWPRRLLVGVGLLLALVLAGGSWRLAALRAELAGTPTIEVAVVQVNLDQGAKNRARDHIEALLERLVPPTLEADAAGAELVAWPEAAYPAYTRPGTRSFAAGRAGLPPLRQAHLLLGAATLEEVRDPAGGPPRLRVENSTFLVGPDLAVKGRYVKHHLVPFGEYVPLADLLPFLKQVVPGMAPASPGGALNLLEFRGRDGMPVRVGSMICFDAIFPEIGLAFARQDPDLLVNPTNDAWYGYSSGPYQFLDIVRLRAVETGRAIARPAYSGVSALILPTGELLPGSLEVGPVDPELAPRPEEPSRVLRGRLPRLHGLTPYARIGDLFAGTCAVLSLAALVAARRARRTAKTR